MNINRNIISIIFSNFNFPDNLKFQTCKQAFILRSVIHNNNDHIEKTDYKTKYEVNIKDKIDKIKQLNNGHICLTTYDNDIVLLSTTFEIIKLITVFTKFISHILEFNNLILFTSNDNLIRIYEKPCYILVKTIIISSTSLYVRDIVPLKNRFAVCGYDNKVLVWNIHQEFKCLGFTISNPTTLVEDMLGNLLIGRDNGFVEIYNSHYEVTNEFRPHFRSVNRILVLSVGALLTAADEESIMIWNTKHELMFSIKIKSPIKYLAEIPNQRILYSTESINVIRLKDYQLIISIAAGFVNFCGKYSLIFHEKLDEVCILDLCNLKKKKLIIHYDFTNAIRLKDGRLIIVMKNKLIIYY
jgi:WD40 repeat protein